MSHDGEVHAQHAARRTPVAATTVAAVAYAVLAAGAAADPRQGMLAAVAGIAGVAVGAHRRSPPLVLVGVAALVVQYGIALVGQPVDLRAPLLAAVLAVVIESAHAAVEGPTGRPLREGAAVVAAGLVAGVVGGLVLVASALPVDQTAARAVAVGAAAVAWAVTAVAVRRAVRR